MAALVGLLQNWSICAREFISFPSVVDGHPSAPAMEATESWSSHYSQGHTELLSDESSFVHRPDQRLSWQESFTPTGSDSLVFPLNLPARAGKRQTPDDAPGAASSSTTWPTDRPKLFKPTAIRPTELDFSAASRKLDLAHPRSRGSAFVPYGQFQPIEDRSRSPVLSLASQDGRFKSRSTAEEFIQVDPIGTPPVEMSIVPESPKKDLDVEEVPRPIIRSTVDNHLKEATKEKTLQPVISQFYKPVSNHGTIDQRPRKLKRPLDQPIYSKIPRGPTAKRLKTLDTQPSSVPFTGRVPKDGLEAEGLRNSVTPLDTLIRGNYMKLMEAQNSQTSLVRSHASLASYPSSKVSELGTISDTSHSSIPLVRIEDVKAFYSHQALSWSPKNVNVRAARGSHVLAQRFLRSIGDLGVKGVLERMHNSNKIMIPFTYDLISKDWKKANWTRVRSLWQRFWKNWDESTKDVTDEETLRTFLWISDYICETTIPELHTSYRTEQQLRRSAPHLRNRQAALLKNMSLADPNIYQMKTEYLDSGSRQVFESFLYDNWRSGSANLKQPALSRLHNFVLWRLNKIAKKVISGLPLDDRDKTQKMPKDLFEEDLIDSILYQEANPKSLIGGHSKHMVIPTDKLDILLKTLTDEVFQYRVQDHQEFLFQPERIRRFFIENGLYIKVNLES
ncbi:hypothetical protein PSTT_02027 [Puccinia striiformis]|uniref:Uncharacterized protein n=1 Tax=Puccinia striiformis TaxID=27350 RepID=A0A2S4W1I0_9BASI|nr:hypothetical protein PSTT_02027 [Puccinia striiformis]